MCKKNSKDIESLKHQMSMGKGGIKAIFVVGSLIALIVAVLKFVKLQEITMKEFFIFVGDMWNDLSPRQRVSVAVVSAIFIFIVVKLIF